MGNEIEILIQKIARLPGLGQRSARRLVLYLLKDKDKYMTPLMIAMDNVFHTVKTCPICGNIDTFENFCHICTDKSRKNNIICIVESVSDLWAIERSNCYHGQYHVLGGLLSSFDSFTPENLKLDFLRNKILQQNVDEIVVALSATIDGQTTDHFIKSYFGDLKEVKLSSLSQGIPIGGELDYLDDGTLFTAFNLRK